MIAPLRKRHRYVWVVLAILLPTMVFVVFNSSKPKTPVMVEIPYGSSLIKKAESSFLAVYTQKLDSSYFIVVNLKTPYKSPFPAIYALPQGNSNLEEGTLLGAIGGSGWSKYEIATDKVIKQVLIYDEIHSEILDSIVFE